MYSLVSDFPQSPYVEAMRSNASGLRLDLLTTATALQRGVWLQKEGNLITAIAKRRNVLDSRFLLQQDAKQRFADVKRIYTAYLEIEVVSLLDKYGAEYIYFSDNAKTLFNKEELSYVGKCFEKVYDKDVQIYQRKGCELTVVK